MVKNGNFTLLLTSSGQEWQFLLQCIYIAEKWTPPGQFSTDALHTGTLVAGSSTMHIDRRQMNPPGQSIIDALNTATLQIYIRQK